MRGLSTSAPKDHVAALDGLRFVAAILVASAHYAAWTLPESELKGALISLSGLGMTLFFVLSGFVIHYNYGATLKEPNGFKRFIIARFSRLYPLYAVLFLIEFLLIDQGRYWSSCKLAGSHSGILFALPYYLTLTQDWVFGVICQNNLIYQYGMMAAVSWSISAEIFFYAVYCFYGRWAIRSAPSSLFAVAAFGYAALFVFVYWCFENTTTIEQAALIAFGPIATVQYGYQDSLIRWLIYFAPVTQFVHFLGGVAIAQTFIQSKSAVRHGTLIVPLCIFAILAMHLYLYLIVAPTSAFIGRNASSFCGPLVVLAVYSLTAWPKTIIPRLLSQSIIVKGGEASYSLYLLHAFLFPYLPYLARHLQSWALWGASLIILIGLSRMSYVLFERPARTLLRAALGTRRKAELYSQSNGL